MTKPVTGVGLMRLWEQGRFGLDEPLAKYLPEYARRQSLRRHGSGGQADPQGARPADPDPRYHAPHRRLRLLGRADAIPNKIFAEVDPLNLDNTLDQFSQKLATVPLITSRARNGATAPRSMFRRG